MRKQSTSSVLLLISIILIISSSCSLTRTVTELDPTAVKKYKQACPDMAEFIDPRDSTVYRTIQIGNQCWMQENLKWLPSVSHPKDNSLVEPHYYVYGYHGRIYSLHGNNPDIAKTFDSYKSYGVLYNWNAALNACPPGWQLPSEEDFWTLTDYLVNNYKEIDEDNLASHLMSARKVRSSLGEDYNTRVHPRWDRKVTQQGIDSFGFSFLPGGQSANGSFCGVGRWGSIWSNSEVDSFYATVFFLPFPDEYLPQCVAYKASAYTIRCLKKDDYSSVENEENFITKSLFDISQDYQEEIRRPGFKRITISFLTGTSNHFARFQLVPYENLAAGMIFLSNYPKEKIRHLEPISYGYLMTYERRSIGPTFFISPIIRFKSLSLHLNGGIQTEKINYHNYVSMFGSNFFLIDNDFRIRLHLYLEPGLRYYLFDWLSAEFNIPIMSKFGVNGGISLHLL